MDFFSDSCLCLWICQRWVNPPSHPMIRSNFWWHFLGKSAALMSPNASPLEICMERCSFDLWDDFDTIYPDISSGQIEIIPNRIQIIPNQIKIIPNQIKIIPNQIEIIPNRMYVSLNGGTPAISTPSADHFQ